jgi:tetratricopeptide (TPR) repeat protein
MGEFWYSRGYFSEGHRRLAEALDAVGPGHERRAWGELAAGMIADGSGDLGEAARLYAAALASGRTDHDTSAMALALMCGIGGASMHEHIASGAEAIVEESLELASSCDDRWVLAFVTGSAGIVWFRLGDRARALEAYEEALRLCRELGDEAESARWLNNLAWERTLAGDHERAREASRAAGEIAERIGDRIATAVALSHLGWIALAERSPRDAREHFGRSLAITDMTGFRAATAWNLLGLAHVGAATGDDRTAGLLAAAALQSDAMGDVAYLMRELGLPEISSVATDELPSQRAAVELAFSFATQNS